jgi:hypothetical protein
MPRIRAKWRARIVCKAGDPCSSKLSARPGWAGITDARGWPGVPAIVRGQAVLAAHHRSLMHRRCAWLRAEELLGEHGAERQERDGFDRTRLRGSEQSIRRDARLGRLRCICGVQS